MIRTDGIEINLVQKTISHRGYCKRFARPLAFALTRHLILSFLNADELFDLLYGHRSDGGPNQGRLQILTMICQKRVLFDRLQLQFDKIRGGHCHTRYRLVPKP